MSDIESGYIPPEQDIAVPEVQSVNELLSDEPKNKWEETLRAQGVPLDIAPRFLDPENLPDEVDIDPLTGLPIEQDEYRTFLAKQFSNAIKNGTDWVLLLGDVDNLKLGNTKHGRELGDMVIVYGAADFTQKLDALNLPHDVIQHVARQTGAADENLGLILNLAPEQLEQFPGLVDSLGRKIVVEDPKHTFSQTFSAITSRSPEAQPYIQSAQEYLRQNPDGIAYSEYNALKELADNEVKLKKISKDMERIPVERLAGANASSEVRQILIEDLGDSRISTALLEQAAEIVEFETHWKYRNGFDTVDAYIAFARKIGVSETMIKKLTSDNARVEFYNSLVTQ